MLDRGTFFSRGSNSQHLLSVYYVPGNVCNNPVKSAAHHHFTGEKTGLERLCDLWENPPELKRCSVSYREMSTFWLILAQPGGLPVASVSHMEDCEMMGKIILHEVHLEGKGLLRIACFSHRPLVGTLHFSNHFKKLSYFAAGTTPWLNEFHRFSDYLLWDFAYKKCAM